MVQSQFHWRVIFQCINCLNICCIFETFPFYLAVNWTYYSNYLDMQVHDDQSSKGDKTYWGNKNMNKI